MRFLTWSTTWNEPMQPMFQQYTAKTGTKVTLEWETQADHDAKVTAGLASDTAPDLILSVSQIDTKFYDAGAMLNLSPYVQRDKLNLRRDYALMGTEFWCDKVYGLPWHAASSAIYYNKSMLREAGVRDPWADGKGEWSWEDMATIARRVTRPPRAEDPGLWGLWWPYSNITYFGPHIWGLGGDFVDWEKMRWTLDNPVSLEAFQRFAGWMAKDRFVISDPQAAASPGPSPDATSSPPARPPSAGASSTTSTATSTRWARTSSGTSCPSPAPAGARGWASTPPTLISSPPRARTSTAPSTWPPTSPGPRCSSSSGATS